MGVFRWEVGSGHRKLTSDMLWGERASVAQTVIKDLEGNNGLISCPSNWESFPVLAGGMEENSSP